MADECQRDSLLAEMGRAVKAMRVARYPKDHQVAYDKMQTAMRQIRSCPCGECCTKRAIKRIAKGRR